MALQPPKFYLLRQPPAAAPLRFRHPSPTYAIARVHERVGCWSIRQSLVDSDCRVFLLSYTLAIRGGCRSKRQLDFTRGSPREIPCVIRLSHHSRQLQKNEAPRKRYDYTLPIIPITWMDNFTLRDLFFLIIQRCRYLTKTNGGKQMKLFGAKQFNS